MIKWEAQVRKYSNGYDGKVGKYRFFCYEWDGSSPPEGRPWMLHCFLPGFKDFFGHFATEELSRAKAEDALKLWLERTGLQSKEKE